jgi:N-carbamoylputrescine amidase
MRRILGPLSRVENPATGTPRLRIRILSPQDAGAAGGPRKEIAMESKRTVKIGLIQNSPNVGAGIRNLESALPLIEAAAAAGARLIVLPELSASGYRPATGIWRAAEAAGGPTERWMRDAARALGAYLCAGYLETDGTDFFNTYTVAGPDGRVLGRVRKESPSMGETYLFRGESGSHVLETPIGRIGIGICNDNHMAYLPARLRTGGAELLLMPHAWPFPSAPSKLVSREDIERQRANMFELAARYARGLGIPAVFTNLSGSLEMGGERSPGFLGALLPPPERYVFPGYGALHGGGGEILRSREGGEGWIVGEVVLGGGARPETPMPAYGRRVYPGHSDSGILRLYERLGRRDYVRSSARRKAAREAFEGSRP